MKCGDVTTAAESYAAGAKNPLRRICIDLRGFWIRVRVRSSARSAGSVLIPKAFGFAIVAIAIVAVVIVAVAIVATAIVAVAIVAVAIVANCDCCNCGVVVIVAIAIAAVAISCLRM